MKEKIDFYSLQVKNASPQECMAFFLRNFPGEAGFATSLGLEDQVITDLIVKSDLRLHIFTLDTGRLFQETYDILHVTEKKYGIKIKVYFPDSSKIEKMVEENGINLFYQSIENRKLCCNLRKIDPLHRALKGMKVWITGLRKEQSVTRSESSLVEWDDDLQVIKVNPLIDWSFDKVWEYIRTNKVPYNELHDKGFPSIGCQPCTRAILEGEDIRAGRWWWEHPENRECGLHKK